MRDPLASKIEEVAQTVAVAEGLELVEVEVKGEGGARLVRISIDKPDGVTHGDCSLVSERVGAMLDANDVIPGHYTLEVSSPGVERKLLKPQDYERFQGRKAKVTLRNPLDGQRNFEGTLAGYSDGQVVLVLELRDRVGGPEDVGELIDLSLERVPELAEDHRPTRPFSEGEQTEVPTPPPRHSGIRRKRPKILAFQHRRSPAR